MSDDEQVRERSGGRWSSLSSRLALLFALVLIASGLVTAAYSAFAARQSAEASSQQAMANAHSSTGLLIEEAYKSQEAFRTAEVTERKTRLQDITELQVSALDSLRDAVQKGELTEQQAKDHALQQMLAFRYDKTNYLFTYTPDMVALENPNPTFLGNQLNTKDANGKAFFQDFRSVALGPGAGFVDYVGTKLGSTTPAPKVSYIQYYKPWQWVIGTGVYIDDIDATVAASFDTVKKDLSASLTKRRFADTGFFFVLDKDGAVVVAPEGKDLSAVTGTDWGRAFASEAVRQGAGASEAPVSLTLPAGFDGGLEPWSVQVSSFPALGWTLVSTVPTAEVDAPGNSLALRQALLSLGVLLLGLLIGLLASRRIVKPVAQVTSAAVALSNDSFDPTSLDKAAARRDEVGTLARTFQRMGAEVVERERKLREQVKKLSVVIDRQKVEEEAGAIVESDYFKDLQERASQLRDRSKP